MPEELGGRLKQRCEDARRARAEVRLVDAKEGAVLQSVSISSPSPTAADRWLRLRASDGTTWYLEWSGDEREAAELVADFGRVLAEDIFPLD